MVGLPGFEPRTSASRTQNARFSANNGEQLWLVRLTLWISVNPSEWERPRDGRGMEGGHQSFGGSAVKGTRNCRGAVSSSRMIGIPTR